MVQSSGKTNIDQTGDRAPMNEENQQLSYFFHVYIGRRLQQTCKNCDVKPQAR